MVKLYKRGRIWWVYVTRRGRRKRWSLNTNTGRNEGLDELSGGSMLSDAKYREPATVHDLRHTFASRLVMAGVDIRTVQELMGHKTYTMTLRYAHLGEGHLRVAIERIVEAPKPTASAPTESTPTEQPKTWAN